MSRNVSKHIASGLCSGLLLAMSVPASAGVDAKLLEMLKANGSITPAQHAELQDELAKEQKEQAQNKSVAAKFEEKLAWAARTQLKGDVRIREETINVDSTGNNQNRQRLRMRLGAYSQINDTVDAGIRIASGSNADPRATNQNMDNYFNRKSIWLDQAYIDWHPGKDVHLIGGKMPYAWVNVDELIWDSDINPEGIAANYKHSMGSHAEWFGSIGYYNMKDNVDGNGTQWKHDTQLYAGQFGFRFKPADQVAIMLGASMYAFDNGKASNSSGFFNPSYSVPQPATLYGAGNTTSQFQLWEGFGKIDFTGWTMPLSIYGQYVVNTQAKDQFASPTSGLGGNGGDSGDTAWLLGVKTGVGKFKFDYNYRDVQRNAVVSIFTDSDFANGFPGARGHKFKMSYDLGNNFTVGGTYFLNKVDNYMGIGKTDVNFDRLMVDLEAKF